MSSVDFESDDFGNEVPLDDFGDDFGAPTDTRNVGKTSTEAPVGAGGTTSSDNISTTEKLKSGFTVFDAMLLISLICVTLATLRMFMAMGEYGNIFSSYPWRVN